MELSKLKKFAQQARKSLIKQIDVRLQYVQTHDDEYIRAHAGEKKHIRELLDTKGKDQFLEEVAFIWFNRVTALRFMDNRGYNRVRIVSPSEGESQPQLLSELKGGKVPEGIEVSAMEIKELLSGRTRAAQPDREAYKTALLAYCNHLGSVMPYMFEKVHDWAALLLPTDLLSKESIITAFQNNITPDDCEDVEVIGWLYQFYISEKKDQVFSRRNTEKIKPEDIPAATQLFTPHWIVRFMTENSLGRLWIHSRPKSSLKEKMKYFVETDSEGNCVEVSDPKEIKVLDPACGSGHILVYAFDLLFMIYEEEGYTPTEIPSLILTNNLFGIDIDDRAAALASFALGMKAREQDRFFFEKGVIPNVIASRNVEVDLKEAGIRLSPDLQESFEYLKQAKNLGSLVPVSKGVLVLTPANWGNGTSGSSLSA